MHMENRTIRTILNFFIAHPHSKVKLIPYYTSKRSAGNEFYRSLVPWWWNVMKDVEPPIFRDASADYGVESSRRGLLSKASTWKEGEMILWLFKRNLQLFGYSLLSGGKSACLFFRQPRNQGYNVPSWSVVFKFRPPMQHSKWKSIRK